MKSVTTARFRKAYDSLPHRIQHLAKKAYSLWRKNPSHPSLHFKQIHKTHPFFSVRITLSWRAIAIKEEETMIWFWIGSHSDYDKIISNL